MHQAMRVQQRERRRDVAQMAAGLAIRQRCELLQVLPVQQLHRVVRTVFGQTVVVDLDDARVLEPHQRVVLAFEQRLVHATLESGSTRLQLLERNNALVGEVLRAIDRAHAAGTELVDELVTSGVTTHRIGFASKVVQVAIHQMLPQSRPAIACSDGLVAPILRGVGAKRL